MDPSPIPPAGSGRLPAAARRVQLLDAARNAFAAHGFHATSMADVAEAAGVTKPVVYQHFGSKRALYLELLDDVGGRLLAVVAKATAEAQSPREQVEQGFRAYFRFVAGDNASFTLLFGSGARRDDEFAEAVRRVEDTIAEAIAPLIDAGLTPEHSRTLAHALVGMAEGTSRHWVSRGQAIDADRLAAWVSSLAWSGLRGVRRH